MCDETVPTIDRAATQIVDWAAIPMFDWANKCLTRAHTNIDWAIQIYDPKGMSLHAQMSISVVFGTSSAYCLFCGTLTVGVQDQDCKDIVS